MYSKNSDSIVLTPDNIAFLKVFADALPFDIVVTSGKRSALQQVQAVWTKLNLGDNIKAVYKDQSYTQSMIDFYDSNDFDGAVSYQDQYWVTNKSAHGMGLGVDIRTRDKSPDQIRTMKEVAEGIGVKLALIEQTPPHLHISHYTKDKYEKKNMLILGLIPLIIWMVKK